MSQSNVKFPYKGWVLMPSFAPKELTFTEKSWYSPDFHLTEASSKYYSVDEIYKSKSDAIAAGREQLKKLMADLEKRAETIRKRCAALDKAEVKP